MSTIRSEVTISTTSDYVWWAWTRADRITTWFAPHANIEERIGGAFELFFDPSNHDSMSTKGCVFTTLEPKTRLGFTWKGPDQFAAIMNNPEKLTQVFVTLHEENGKTTVTLEHQGWGEGPEWDEAKKWHQAAWDQMLASLKSSIEAGKGQLCCAP